MMATMMATKKYTKREQLLLHEVSSWPEWKQDFFWSMVNEKKQTISFAHMAASQQGPRSMTDSVMMSGLKKIKDYPEQERNYICREAMKKGYKPRPDDAYMGTMASKGVGDPAAFFNHGEGLSKIREVCRERGHDSHGIIDVKGHREPESDPRGKGPKLHKRIVKRIKEKMVKENPDIARKPAREVEEMIIDRHGNKKKGK